MIIYTRNCALISRRDSPIVYDRLLLVWFSVHTNILFRRGLVVCVGAQWMDIVFKWPASAGIFRIWRSWQITSWTIVCSSDTIYNLNNPYFETSFSLTCYLGDCCTLSHHDKAAHLKTLRHTHSQGTWICKMEQYKEEDREVVTSLQRLPLGLFCCPFSSYVLVQHPN